MIPIVWSAARVVEANGIVANDNPEIPFAAVLVVSDQWLVVREWGFPVSLVTDD